MPVLDVMAHFHFIDSAKVLVCQEAAGSRVGDMLKDNVTFARLCRLTDWKFVWRQYRRRILMASV